ncbi:ATP-binding protein [Aldersonia sp. NBC_00410]|uniref:ATP-binding protein n=1 Tax=Aldersonia sp. NBC_00410 TaxID=2975954 RepID=UPI002259BDF3|nr:ATP-binding protein [Aldersonia sp. NBC_00410]MCX5041848.1 ATP-binding protein [Aldersonia sp. NBC_00410]
MTLQDTDAAVELRVRADPGQLGVIRAVAATMAAQCNFDLDEIADVRLAADEAASFLIVRAQARAQLICKFLVEPGHLWMSVCTPIGETVPPSRRGFGWHVLTTLTDSVDLHQTPTPNGTDAFLSTIEFTKQSIVGVAGAELDGAPGRGSGPA